MAAIVIAGAAVLFLDAREDREERLRRELLERFERIDASGVYKLGGEALLACLERELAAAEQKREDCERMVEDGRAVWCPDAEDLMNKDAC